MLWRNRRPGVAAATRGMADTCVEVATVATVSVDTWTAGSLIRILAQHDPATPVLVTWRGDEHAIDYIRENDDVVTIGGDW
jgi:hypothetical protein